MYFSKRFYRIDLDSSSAFLTPNFDLILVLSIEIYFESVEFIRLIAMAASGSVLQSSLKSVHEFLESTRLLSVEMWQHPFSAAIMR